MNISLLMPVWRVARMAYNLVLRKLLLEAIEDPEEIWDDMVLAISDSIFNIEEFTFEPIWEIAKEFYADVLRPILLKRVEGTETEFDDRLLAMVDRIFQYTS